MKKYLFIFTLFVLGTGMMLFVCFSDAEETAFSYSDNGRRDPFWPLVSPSGAVLVYGENIDFADMTLEGIIYDPRGERLAIVNGKIVKASDNVGGFAVISVEEERVVLQKDGKEFILQLKKE